MSRNDTVNVQPAAFSPVTTAPRPLLEPVPVEPARLLQSVDTPNVDVDDEEGEIVETTATQQKSILDAPLVRKAPSGDNGKLAKPIISGSVGPVVSMFASLFLVIMLFLVFALLFRKVTPNGSGLLPKELFESLGRAPLTQKIQLQLLRLGNRLILVSVTADGVQPITEITDPDEVVQLLGLCRRLDSNSSTQNFKKMLNALSEEPADGGYFGTDVEPRPRSRGKAARTKSSLDLYSESDESLTDLLANGLKGGRNG
jgi:flagellar biogenesis protein FliO